VDTKTHIPGGIGSEYDQTGQISYYKESQKRPIVKIVSK
jgi:hypothetical protein